MSSGHEGLYLNGLERTGVGVPERALAAYLRLRGVRLEHAAVDWHAGTPFQELFDAATERAEQKLRQNGRLAIVGASAGGSLGLNVFQRLRAGNPERDVSLITLSAWLQAGDRERLEHTALHRPGKQPSEAFRDSVLYCNTVAISLLTEADKARMLTTYPSADEAVPLEVMTLDGVEFRAVPINGHVPGIALGALMLPGLLAELQPQAA